MKTAVHLKVDVLKDQFSQVSPDEITRRQTESGRRACVSNLSAYKAVNSNQAAPTGKPCSYNERSHSCPCTEKMNNVQ